MAGQMGQKVTKYGNWQGWQLTGKVYPFETLVPFSLVHNCFLPSLDVDLYY